MAPTAQVVLIIVAGLIAFAALFRAEIRKRLQDLRNVTFPGGSADLTGNEAMAQIEAQKRAPEGETLPVPTAQPDPSPPQIPAPSVVFEPIEADLRRRIETSIPGNLTVQMAWAVRLAAAAQVERDHEVTYRLIFGSQIAALKVLNVRSPITVALARDFYLKTAVQHHPDVFKPTDFEGWADFLVTRGLVVLEKTPVDDDTLVALAPLGRDFLMFVTGRGLSENKGF